MRDIHMIGNKPMDCFGLHGEWSLDVGRATLGECQSRLYSLFSWVTSVKKMQVLRHDNVSLKHYTFPHILKKLEGTL